MKPSATRDSGVPWIGKVRADWPILPAKAVFKQRSTASRPDDVHLTPSQHHGVMPQAEYMALTGNQVVLNLTGADNMRHVEPGDYISHLRSFQGGLEYSAYAGKVSAAYTVLTPRKEVDPHYYRYLFKSMQYVQGLQTTTDQMRDGQSIRYGQFALLPLPYPPLQEQRRIAEFLDRETAQIDELIAKQEQLISTLAERSAAFRFHLTTGGLEERSRSVPSNSPWFPDLPERWVMAPVKYHARTGAGAGFPLEAQGLTDEQYPFLKVNALSRADDDGVIRWQEDTVSIEMASKLGAKIYPAGSCIIAKIGAALLMGRVRQLSAPSCVDNNVMALIPQGSTNPRFLYYALQNLRPDWLVNPGAVPSTSEGAVGRVRLPFPPAAEQIAIAKALDVYMGKVMATERKLEAALTVLRERRQALISAAVTGQIDVGGAS